MCRGGARDISRAIPTLLDNNVRVVGIGLEPLGMDEFVEGGFWKGELYLDNGKKSYQALSLKSTGILGALSMIFLNKAVKAELDKYKSIPGNLKGDGMQLGATFVFDKGGAMVLDYRQRDFGDHPTPEALLKALDLDPSGLSSPSEEEEVCKK